MSARAAVGPAPMSPVQAAADVVVRAQVTGTHPAAVEAVQAVLEGFKRGERPARASRWAGLRRRPDELVTVTLTGRPRPVFGLAAALARVAVVTGMSHRAGEASRSAVRDGWVRVDVTCYPARRLPAEGRLS